MSTRCRQAEILPTWATNSVRQLITAAELGNSSSSKAVLGSPGPDTELPDCLCSWSNQQPELSINCLLHTTSQTAPPSPTLSPRLSFVANQHLGTSSGMSNYDRGAPLPSPGSSRRVAHLSSSLDDGPADATFQGREPALDSLLLEGSPLELCNKVNLPHCLVSRAKCLSGSRCTCGRLRGLMCASQALMLGFSWLLMRREE